MSYGSVYDGTREESVRDRPDTVAALRQSLRSGFIEGPIVVRWPLPDTSGPVEHTTAGALADRL